MEFKDILRFATLHYKLLILGVILGGLAGLLVAYMSPAPYEATSKILISRTKSDKGSDFGYLTDTQLIQTYAYILKTRPILDIVEEKVDSKVNTDNVKVNQVPETLILQITVQDENPEKAAYLANAFAEAMVIQSQQLQEEQYDLQEEGLSSQIAAVQSQIDDLEALYDKQETTVNESIMDDVDKQILAYRSEILSLQKDIAPIKTPENLDQESYLIDKKSRLAEIQPLLTLYQEIRTNLELLGRPYQSGSAPEDTTLSRLKTTIDQYQQVNLTLVNSLETIRLEKVQRAPTVVTIENANIPKDRTSLSFVLNPIIAGGAGLIMAILAGLVFQRKRVKISSQEDLLQSLGLDLIGTIRPLTSGKPRMAIDLTAKNLDANGKAFYDLRAYLEYQRVKKPFRSLLITSFGSEAGKSTVASNLAANYALGGDEVVLVDANFAHADQHDRFKVENKAGLTDLLFRDHAYDNNYLQGTLLKNLSLLPVGSYQIEPFQLIDPLKITGLINEMGMENNLIIIDGPSLTDLNTRLLAASADRILVVMREGIYSLDGLEETLDDLEQDREKILGVVLNELSAAKESSIGTEKVRSTGISKKFTQLITNIRGLTRNKDLPAEGKDSPERLSILEKTNPHIEKNLEIAEAIKRSKQKVSDEQVDFKGDAPAGSGSNRDLNPIEVIPDPPEKPSDPNESMEVLSDPPSTPNIEGEAKSIKPKSKKEIRKTHDLEKTSPGINSNLRIPRSSVVNTSKLLNQSAAEESKVGMQPAEISSNVIETIPEKLSRKAKNVATRVETIGKSKKTEPLANEVPVKAHKEIKKKRKALEESEISQKTLPSIDLTIPPQKKRSAKVKK